MNEPFERAPESPEPLSQPYSVERRALLRQGAKLAYIAPVVLLAMQAGAHAQPGGAEQPPISPPPVPHSPA